MTMTSEPVSEPKMQKKKSNLASQHNTSRGGPQGAAGSLQRQPPCSLLLGTLGMAFPRRLIPPVRPACRRASFCPSCVSNLSFPPFPMHFETTLTCQTRLPTK